jgi:HK97 family phage prohead protease
MTTFRRAVAGHVTKFLSTVGERQIRVIASDPTPDRMGDILEPGGCQLDDFRQNPVMLAQHDSNKPIGSWPSIQVNGGRMEALGEFAPEGVSELADEYCRLAKSGILKAVSVGFIPIQYEPRRGGGCFFKTWDLIELSIVSVGANPAALVIERRLSGAASRRGDPELRDLIGQLGRVIRAARLRTELPPRQLSRDQRMALARQSNLGLMGWLPPTHPPACPTSRYRRPAPTP